MHGGGGGGAVAVVVAATVTVRPLAFGHISGPPTDIVPASSFASCYYGHCVAPADIVPTSSFSTCYYDHVWGGDTSRGALDVFTLATDLVVGFRAPHFFFLRCGRGRRAGRRGGKHGATRAWRNNQGGRSDNHNQSKSNANGTKKSTSKGASSHIKFLWPKAA